MQKVTLKGSMMASSETMSHKEAVALAFDTFQKLLEQFELQDLVELTVNTRKDRSTLTVKIPGTEGEYKMVIS